jgi:hypothetical protein
MQERSTYFDRHKYTEHGRGCDTARTRCSPGRKFVNGSGGRRRSARQSFQSPQASVTSTVSDMILKVEQLEQSTASVYSGSTSTPRESLSSSAEKGDRPKVARRRSDRVSDLLTKISNLVVEIDNRKQSKGKEDSRRERRRSRDLSTTSSLDKLSDDGDHMSELSDGSNIARRVEAARQSSLTMNASPGDEPHTDIPKSVEISES